MIAWLAPWALAGLGLLAGPLVVHMLRRRNARRIVFPTTKFLHPTQAAAVRFRRPSDVALLLIRLAIVLAAVLAAGRPLLLGGWRTARWDARVARAVLLDTSQSVSSAPAAEQLARQEMQAFAAATFRTADLREGVQRAADWIARTPPARREIVIVSDFQRGALDAAALAAVPAEVGIRFVRIGTHPGDRSVSLPPLNGWRGGLWNAAASIRGDALDASWSRTDSSRPLAWVGTMEAESDAGAASRALMAAASFGVPPGDERRRVTVAFQGANPTSGEGDVRTPWMLRALVDLGRSDLLRETGATIQGAERDGTLVVHANVTAGSAAAPAVIRAAMLAVRPPQIADPEMETATISDSMLAAWRRDPAPLANIPTGSLGSESDARWLWALALLLLGVESWLRRRRPRVTQIEEVQAHAA